ncbi:MAG: hypothetical protein CBB83_08300 [Rhodospirillaceae bacterium TMED23]|nr:MAG: hypothetical protein CBB83_08300 [Rhodospirillaceae bacterium TMED23]
MINFAALRDEVKKPLKHMEMRKLHIATKEKDNYCSLESSMPGYLCLCSCILDGITFYIYEKK